ncbi:lipase 1, partial [Thozetella sp. PMI_491]
TPCQPIIPSQDDFYTSKPDNLKAYSSGDIIRLRVAPGNLSALFNASAVYHVVYRTTDSLNEPTWALTTIFAPIRPYRSSSSSCNDKGSALLSYLDPYNTAWIDGSASWLLNDPTQLSDEVDIPASLSRGWFVALPDFEGVLAASTAGHLEGHAILDGVTATYQLADLGRMLLTYDIPPLMLERDAKFTLWGYSGGALSGGWAAELQAEYAPHLGSRFAGVAFGGLAINFSAIIEIVSGTENAGVAPPGIVGIAYQYPKVMDFLVSHLKPENASEFLAVKNLTFVEGFVHFNGKNLFDYFINGRDDLFAEVFLDLWATEYDIGHSVPAVPAFFYKAIGDQFSAVQFTDQLVDNYCKQGANVLYQRNTVGGHLEEFQNGHTRVLDWLESIFNGTYGERYNDTGCTIENVTV